MEILIWSLVAYGMSNILVWGSIFSTARQAIHDMANIPGLHQPIANFFSGLIQCMMCTSTWVGFFLSLVYYSPSQEWMNFTPFFSWFSKWSNLHKQTKFQGTFCKTRSYKICGSCPKPFAINIAYVTVERNDMFSVKHIFQIIVVVNIMFLG